jgi:hypothetical protein
MQNITLAEFQHSILRQWVFASNGRFLRDLLAGNETVLHDFLRTHIANTSVAVTKIPPEQGLLLIFPPPENPTECHFIFLSTKGKKTRIFTCEYGMNLHGPDPIPYVCELFSDRSRRNYGRIANFDLETFIARLHQVLNDKR